MQSLFEPSAAFNSLEPPFEAPPTRDKQRDERERDKQPVFRIRNVKVVLRAKNDVVIAAQIDHGTIGWLAPGPFDMFSIPCVVVPVKRDCTNRRLHRAD